jgi:hypothetical protein
MFRLSHILVPATTLLFSAVALPAGAQSYTSQLTSGTYSSISATGNLITLTDTDDGYGSFSSPFQFSFFGNTVFSGDALYVSSNGMLAIGAAQTAHSNTTIPTSGTPDNFIAPFWDDLTNLSGAVLYSTQGSSGSYVLVVEWFDTSHYSYTSETASFQVRIYQATGVIELWYGPRFGGSGWSGSVGVEGSTGTSGTSELCSSSCTLDNFPQGTIVRYTPGASSGDSDLVIYFVDPLPSSVNEGSSYSLSWGVENYGISTSGQTEIGIFAGLSPTVTASDFRLDSQIVSPISSGGYTSGFFNATVPVGLSGTYYIAAIVDPFNVVGETDEQNNRVDLGAVTVIGNSSGTIAVTTEFLPGATSGQFYNVQLTQTGASVPSWDVMSGTLPPGLSLSTSGSLSGTPSGAGSYNFVVRASESGKTPGTATLSIDVGGGVGLRVTNTSLPNAFTGVPYNVMLTADGGIPPYAFNIIQGKPDWMSINSQGAISGTPDAPGSHSLLISLFDAELRDATITLPFEVTAPTALAINSSLPEVLTGREYSAAVVSGGMPPYAVTVTSGALPVGLAISSSGFLTGLTSRMGSFTASIDVVDANTPPGVVQGSITVVVTEQTGLRITIGDGLAVITNTDARVPLIASGGTPPYTWSLVQGALQGGLSVDPEGYIVGRVDHTATATVTIGVSDSAGASDQAVVYVKSSPYRPNNSGRSGGTRDGCSCEETSASRGSGASLLLALLFGVALVLKRARVR